MGSVSGTGRRVTLCHKGLSFFEHGLLVLSAFSDSIQELHSN